MTFKPGFTTLSALLVLSLGLSACGSSGGDSPELDEPDPVPEPPPAEYFVSGTVSGLSSDSIFVNLLVGDANSNFDPQQLVVSGNDAFRFPDPIPDDSVFTVWGSAPQEPAQRCDADNAIGRRIEGADVVDVAVVCVPGYRIGGTVSGLGAAELNLRLESEGGQLGAGVETFHRTTDDGPYEFISMYREGEAYVASINSISDPDLECLLSNATGAVRDTDVRNVDVDCKSRTISGEVTGLIGSDMEVTLSIDEESGGANVLLDVESIDVDANGSFSFEALLADGAYYEVAVRTQPSSPVQTCSVENGSGIVAGSVDTVAISCPTARRIYRYHDANTLPTISDHFPLGAPLKCGDVQGIEFLDSYEYAMSLAVGLSGVANIAGLPEYFADYADAPPTDGVIYSNDSGFTYWLGVDSGSTATTSANTMSEPEATDSPCEEGLYEGPLPMRFGSSNQNMAMLDTIMHLQKDSDEASVTFHITSINLLGFLELTSAFSCSEPGCLPMVDASADFDFTVSVDVGATRQVVSHQGATVFLLGELTENPDPTVIEFFPSWKKKVVVDSWARKALFTESHFDLDERFGRPSVVRSDQVGYLSLANPIEVKLDLSGVPRDADFYVTAYAGVEGFNYRNKEGGSVAYLRDPAAFDPGQAPELAGASVVELEGVSILDPGTANVAALVGGGVTAVPVCDDPSGPRSTIEFGRAAYTLTEDASINLTLDEVLVVRGGSLAGDVGATVSATSGTALFGEDFADDEVPVRFGDTDDVPRTVRFDIVDDALEEDDESFTITLHSPEGCAEIGPQSTARITILANDPSPGQAAFAVDALEVDESAGEAYFEVRRLGGDAGVLIATVTTADGTAVDGSDYVATSRNVVFNDGETAPRGVRVPLIDDTVPESDKVFTAQLTADNPDLLTSPTTIAVTIRDDDEPAISRFELGAASYSVDETAGSVAIEVLRLDSAAGQASVRFTTSADTATARSDYVDVEANVEFADGDSTPQTVSVTILDDAELEGDHRFTVALASPVNGVLGTPDTATVNIIDDESTTAPPPAPILDMSPDVGELGFFWTPVAEATFFRLLESADGISPFSQIGADIPAGQYSERVSIATHLVDWNAARYLVQACNAAGCTDSNEVSIANAMLGAIGFFKASNTGGADGNRDGDYFGNSLSLSDDGQTLAVAAHKEDSDAVFINGDQSNDDALDAGAVYVFARDGNGWLQQAYVKAPNTHSIMEFGSSLALNADGSRLVVGAVEETGTARGIDGDMTATSTDQSGAAYIYERTGNVWTFATYLKASNTGRNDRFGHAVAMSDDGNTILVGALFEDNAATGINPLDQEDDSALDAGAVYVFEFDAGAWTQTAYVKASNAEADDRFGHALAISGDGSRFAVAAVGEDSAATGIAGDQGDNSAPGSGSRFLGTGAVYTFVRGPGGWIQEMYFKPSNTDEDDFFGNSLALNFDGSVLAVGATREDSAGTGAGSLLEQDDLAPDAGAVYVFVYGAGVWAQESYVKASNTRNLNLFGSALGLSADGSLLVIGAETEDSESIGINGSESQPAFGNQVGAAYVYQRDAATANWSKVSYVKASNSDQSAFPGGRTLAFGRALGLSADGTVLAISGYYDGSDATGIGGDPVNENARRSGAVFLY